jgi:hypothetical protein
MLRYYASSRETPAQSDTPEFSLPIAHLAYTDAAAIRSKTAVLIGT